MTKRSVLIVDDDRAWLRVISAFFRTCGYDVLTALTCAEGLSVAGKYRPGCVLLDFHLPDAEAGHFCSRIRGDHQLKKTPIIIVSADGEQESCSYLEHQADGFVLKGGPLARIRLMVESLLRRIQWERGVIEKGDLRLEAESFTVFRNGSRLARLSVEQFRFLFILVDRSPGFVSEEDILKFIFSTDRAPEKYEALRGVANRLRSRLGARLGRRIKGSSLGGWTYLQPESPVKPSPGKPRASTAPLSCLNRKNTAN